MDAFANDTPANRDEAFRQAAAELGFAKAIVEKDFWVCWSLQHLFALPSFGDHLIFKGGTSLSKAYDVIHRFSEDVDLSLDRAQFGFEGDRDPENPGLSGGKRKSLLQDLQEAAEATVAGPLIGEINTTFSARLDQPFSLQIDEDDPQTILFAYPSLGGDDPAYIKPVVRFEFGARGAQLPADQRTISTYVQQAFPDLPGLTSVDVHTLGIERTFWEKATILHMLFHQDAGKPLADRMSRHYYDMAKLTQHDAKAHALANLDLLSEVGQHKSVFFKAAWARYEDAKPGSLRLTPGDQLKAALRRDYAGMREMIMGDAPSFDDVLSAIGALEAEINAA
ncbi:nucleotidyl transferase AbiEii/AbiGii toxin family protein [Roseovarius sp. SK2]|uniref:nucleotidyl transferase AbiEii/AbiGii toxin family protein n=1 Tax=Roseovarius TaxID=74030 RepID=UPI000CDDD2E2|nr:MULTISPECIES: nucleotidyl transferase AbiEii/AbiGii toxin family protein [Roseovarius]MDD9727603.1 nucleotidyl transferase AbiEii/AbiGii toxin family protein [Roseovarius sp. SK2]